MAHKLVNGQKIAIHNDFNNGDETHRLVIHINPHWKEENGGFLMLFSSSNAEDLSKIINPINNTAFGFEISSSSHHAVSKIYDYIRYTIVYTFKNT
jgi:Rps23 Pro-64 3,4-dihydroxylase Tpa1-like proline 4-hydroxylase